MNYWKTTSPLAKINKRIEVGRMKKRQLGHSSLLVSEIGLGCMSLGTDSLRATRIIEVALDQGINFFDTADLYDYGVNEAIIGETLSSRRDDVIIATKVGNRWNEGETDWRWDPSKAYIKEAVKNSLRRLQTDYIDLYQLHGGTMEDPTEETIEAFEELQSEGIIRYYGLSSMRPNVIRTFIERSPIVSVMMPYNLLDRRPEEMMPLFNEKNVSVLTRGSVAKGLLTNEMHQIILEQGPQRAYLDYSRAEITELMKNLKRKAVTGAHEQERSLNEIALQFNLANESVASVVVGVSSVEQLMDNVKAIQAEPLSTEQLNMLKKMTKVNHYENHR